jgi:toxin ParE1/3/4
VRRADTIWSDESIADLGELWEYIAFDNETAADRVVARIESRIESLLRFPLLGRKGREPGTRELVITGTPYLVIYVIGDRNVQIVRVIHSARQWPPKR